MTRQDVSVTELHLFVREDWVNERPDKNKELPKRATYIQTQAAIEQR